MAILTPLINKVRTAKSTVLYFKKIPGEDFHKGDTLVGPCAGLKRGLIATFIAGTVILILVPKEVFAQSHEKPGPKDRCPVCGMFVSKYPTWIAQVKLENGKVFFFDGAKDMFKFILDPGKYSKEARGQAIQEAWVTDYYSVEYIRAEEAFYVVGSNVYGPMGKELIPFARREDAEEFVKDHKGKMIVTFKEVNSTMINSMDHNP